MNRWRFKDGAHRFVLYYAKVKEGDRHDRAHAALRYPHFDGSLYLDEGKGKFLESLTNTEVSSLKRGAKGAAHSWVLGWKHPDPGDWVPLGELV